MSKEERSAEVRRRVQIRLGKTGAAKRPKKKAKALALEFSDLWTHDRSQLIKEVKQLRKDHLAAAASLETILTLLAK